MNHPLLFDFPQQFETERLLVRLPMPGDGAPLYEAIIHSLPELKPWLEFAQQVPSVEETELNVRQAHIAFLERKDLRMHIFHRETGAFIGSTGLHRINWEVPKFEIGYWIDTRYSGQGYITEAVKGLTDFSFRELHAQRLEIRCDSKNVKSRKVAERLGFELEGILRRDSLSIDKRDWRDTCIYAKLR